MFSISGKTRIVGIIGCPVSHSMSPAMQNAAMTSCNLDFVYVPFAVAPERLGEAVAGLRSLGVHGFNVTIPHKTAIVDFLDLLDKSAEDAGAVNTVLNDNGRLIGFNTDGAGLLRSLADDLDYIPGSGSIVLIGAGGAARGAVAALCQTEVPRIIIVNRTLDTALALQKEMINRFPEKVIEVVEKNRLNCDFLSSSSLLINTTSIGMNSDRIDFLDLSKLAKSAKVYDMVYSPAISPLLYDASGKGHKVANGLGMLAAQGELAFNIWTGRNPPQGLMKRVLETLTTT